MQVIKQEQRKLQQSLLSTAYAQNTLRAYSSAVQGSNGYLLHAEHGIFDIWSDESIAAWLLHGLYTLKWAKNTLKSKFNAVAWYQQVVRRQAWDDSPGSIIHLVRRTVDRLGTDAKPKQAIKANRLVSIMEILDNASMSPGLRAALVQACPLWASEPDHTAAECAAWFALSFACFFRASETASLRWQDISASTADGKVAQMSIALWTSQFEIRKTSASTVTLVLDAVEASDPAFAISAVRRLSALLLRQHGDISGSVFRITMEHARNVLQVLAARVFGRVQSDFGLHSLRSGAACSADEQGVGLARIMFMGRWRSAAVLSYLRADADGASALLLKAKRPGQDSRLGEVRRL